MKKFFAFAFVAVAAAFASCAGNNEQTATDSVDTTNKVEELAPVAQQDSVPTDSVAMPDSTVQK